jgi:hypothetical protein
VIGRNQQFDPYANEVNFLLAAYVFEDVGVTAYKGAAPIIDNKTPAFSPPRATTPATSGRPCKRSVCNPRSRG